MTVYLPKRCRTWYYDFWFHGTRYVASTKQITREDAEDVETSEKRRLRRKAAGLPALESLPLPDTPRFSDWAAVAFDYAIHRKKLKRPEQFAINLKMVLGFWGARPTKGQPIDGPAPYYDLRLIDPIRSPELIEQFEQWMDERGLSGPRKNHYRSAMSQMYRVALKPQYRKRAGVKENPFAHVERDRVPKRLTTLTIDQFRAVVQAAPWHTRVALAIGALAPKLRLRNVLQLRWDAHLPRDRSRLTVPEHKTDRETGLPLIVPVSPELKAVLDAAWKGRRGPFVVHYRGQPVRDIKTGLKHAVEAAGLTFSRSGITYHSLRHTMATEFARMGLPESLRSRLMGHSDLATTQIYTHMVAADEVLPLEELGKRMAVADLIGVSGKVSGLPSEKSKKSKDSAKSRKRSRGESRRASGE
jgi:integrase